MSMRNPQNERYTVEREGRSQGSVKPRTASAKPASKAGASVRTTSKPKPKNAKQRAMAEMNMSKEEKKAARAKEREAENVAYTAIDILTRKDARYKKLRRIWWVLLVVAIIFMVLSWATVSIEMPLAVNIVSLILAYAAIISALVMDFTVVRKCRNKHRDKVASMTRKQQERIVYEAQVEAGAKAAANHNSHRCCQPQRPPTRQLPRTRSPRRRPKSLPRPSHPRKSASPRPPRSPASSPTQSDSASFG